MTTRSCGVSHPDSWSFSAAPHERPSRIQCGGHGRSVWAESVGTVEFELLSTVELKKILKDEDVDEPVVEDFDGAGLNPYVSS